MIPILYEKGTTEYTNNGIGRLSDCISCLVTEERNGIFEVEFEYPITGAHYEDIQESRIISVTHDEEKDRQPFIIYQRTAPINGVVTFYAHHISYLLSNIICRPFTATSAASAFVQLKNNTINANPFTFWTDNTTAGSVAVDVPASVRSILGGSRGGVLDVFGGEYEFDGYVVRNYASRGSDNGVTIRYGKNLTDLEQEVSILGLYDSVVPYWKNDENVVYGGVVTGTGQTAALVETLDLSSEFDEAPTVQELTAKAQTFLDNNKPWIPKENIKVDFISLWQTEEYADVAPLERVKLCDTVTVIYSALGVQATAKVIRVVWDALQDRYQEIELGEARSSFAETVISEAKSGLDDIVLNVPTKSYVQAAIDSATDLITGGLGGHIVFHYDANGKPTEMLIMDTDSESTAVNVLRINVNGIGFSSSGVNGPYTSAWTLDGSFVADFITSGHMSANLIQGGTLVLGGVDNGNGVINVYDASNNLIGKWNKDGLTAKGNLEIDYTYLNVLYQALFGVLAYWKWDNANSSMLKYNHLGFKIGSGSRYYAIITGAPDAVVESLEIPRVASMLNTANSWEKNILFTADNGTNGQIVSFRAKPAGFSIRFKEHGTTPYASASSGNVSINGNAQISIFGRFAMTNTDLRIIPSGASSTSDTSITFIEIGSNRLKLNMTTDMHLTMDSNYVEIKIASDRELEYSFGYWRITSPNRSGTIAVASTSSKRYKHDISYDIDDELDARKLYNLRLAQFVFNDDHKDIQYADMRGKTLIGFIAEDVEEIYPNATIHDADGNVESWDERRLLPPMLALIQEQKKTIDSLEARIENLENALNKVLGVTQ